MSKDGLPAPSLNGRKTSISQGQGGLNSNAQGRPGTRRRETSDSISGNPLATPSTFGRQSREDTPLATPPSSLLRRRTDFKENNTGSPFEKARLETGIDTSSPFGSWKRNVSGPMSAGIAGPSSPWAPSGPQSAGFGAFGNFSIDNSSAVPSTPAEKRLGFGSMRGESRFKGLMSKESSEDMSSNPKERSGFGLEKLSEYGADRQNALTSGLRKDSKFFEDEERIGSAALGGDVPSPPPRGHAGNVDTKRTHDEIGFASFNTPSNLGAIREVIGQRDASGAEEQQNRPLNENTHEPMSPTDTNPYQSPEGDKSTGEDGEEDSLQTPFNPRGHPKPLTSAYDGDRSQTSSAGQQKTFPSLSGLGGLGSVSASGPWSAAPGAVGQQSRSGQGFASPFTESLFGPMGDLSSPGAFGTPTTAAFGGTGRSKMGSLFPTQMQDQMRSEAKAEGSFTERSAFTPLSRDSEIPPQATRGVLDDLFGPSESHDQSTGLGSSPFSVNEGILSNQPPFSSAENNQLSQTQTQPAPGVSSGAPLTAPSGTSTLFGRSPEPDSNSNQPPPAQQRQMVMPDRMRWIYRDPSGNTQGPFSGLEMHDWYKAGFFSPELQVKKLEDSDYEPLAQLIRRIGNSREPFLVPQIGIPHGQPAAPGVLGTGTPGTQPGNAQPPLGNSFPSFGTTLTADQQNALERRKQEEQYLMARQKEHLAQQQAYMKQFPVPGMPVYPQQLHHHSSAHSLQSQPSYGSITSPGGFQQSPAQVPIHPPAPNQGFFDSSIRPGFVGQAPPGENMPVSQENKLPPAMDRLNIGSAAQTPIGAMPSQQDAFSHQQQVANMMQDRARLQAQQQQWDALQKDDGRDNVARLEQFNQLRSQEEEGIQQTGGLAVRPNNQDIAEARSVYKEQQQAMPRIPPHQTLGQPQMDSQAFEQMQHAANDIAPMPSTSPLPAPAAQRNRQHIADVLAAESGSRSQSPADTPTTASLAPWAKENVEGSKGPSLKEIQEAEARASSQREEVAAAARRAAAEQERLALEKAAAQVPAPGLPTSANWAASPVTSTNPAVPWAKPAVGKTATPVTSAKKTIAQIQKEEEARKTRAATAAAAAAANASAAAATNIAGGKRYADLASKVASPTTAANAGGAWTTVGASGKAKVPSSPAVAAAPTRTTSGGLPAATTASSKPKPTAPSRSNTGAGSVQSAHEEFQKWVKGSLSKGLNPGVSGSYSSPE